ncbi:hypothetical protein HYS49_02020 [Candidatus Woesearchaeota archaeon]|nr:hypothetical protein [Candidatus Woesearchaeota archaeon]
MVTSNVATKSVLLHLLKDCYSMHTISLLAKELALSRVGIWKILKKLEGSKYVLLKNVGNGKTSAFIITLNWENPLVEKLLSLYLTEEALKQRRWQVNFIELERITDFVILYGSILSSSRQANDIDILGIASKKNFVKIHTVLEKAQKTQSKKIHSIHVIESEFKAELKKQNKAFIDAVKKGVILFGQDKFVTFMRGIAK